MMYPGSAMGWNGYGLGWWAPMGLVMLAFWGTIIVILVLAVRWLWAQPRPRGIGAPIDAPPEILKRRYALGEITKQEFDRMKQDLA